MIRWLIISRNIFQKSFGKNTRQHLIFTRTFFNQARIDNDGDELIINSNNFGEFRLLMIIYLL